jgi:hypothetical protein
MAHRSTFPWRGSKEPEEDSSPMLTYVSDPQIKLEPGCENDVAVLSSAYFDDSDIGYELSTCEGKENSYDSMSSDSSDNDENENSQTSVVKIEEADTLFEIAQTVRKSRGVKRKAQQHSRATMLSSNYHNIVKRVPGKRTDLVAAWVGTFPRLSEILDNVPLSLGRDLEPSIFSQLPYKIKHYLPRGTRQDTIDVQTATVYTDGTTTCTIIHTPSNDVYIPLNDLRTSQMPIRITRCYHLLTSLAIGYTALKLREKICEPNIPSTYKYTKSRTPLLSLALLLYLASPCKQDCAATQGHCKIPWCWTLRCTINPTMFADVLELLQKRGILGTIENSQKRARGNE